MGLRYLMDRGVSGAVFGKRVEDLGRPTENEHERLWRSRDPI